MCHIPASTTGDEGWDRFSFSIKLEDYKRKIDERQLVLCVHYSVENKDWWDSNNGMNYSFTFKKSAPKSSTLVEVCALRQASGSFAGAAGGGVDVSAGSV